MTPHLHLFSQLFKQLRQYYTHSNSFLPVLGHLDYWLVLFGQFVASISNAIFFGGCTLLSEVWFPSSERATATAIGGAIAPQVGILIAMGVTPVVVHSPLTVQVCNSTLHSPENVVSQWRSTIYQRWLYYQTAVAALAVITLILTILCKSKLS